MQSIDISELMQGSAGDAIVFASEYNCQLDYSLDSIAQAEQLLTQLRTEELNENALFTISYMFGAYLGETFIRHFDGEWLYQPEQGSEPPQTFVVREPYRYAFPSLVYHFLQESEQQSLCSYFDRVKELHQ